MMRRFFKYLFYTFAGLLLLSICLIAPLDRKPYKERAFYREMDERLDSLQQHFTSPYNPDSLFVGVAKVSITPTDTLPLAGYGARNPKEFKKVLDSVFIRTVVLRAGQSKAAIVAADLLIVHPNMARAVRDHLRQKGWQAHEVYFTATHTHSSLGGWAPGLAGKVMTGNYDERVVRFLSEQMVESVIQAEASAVWGQVGYLNNELGMCVKNRLIKGGDEDAWMRNLFFPTERGLVSLTAYAAHATCLGSDSRALSGDYPAHFHRQVARDSSVFFSMFMAGAVGSMAPELPNGKGAEGAAYIGETMAGQLGLLANFGITTDSISSINSFRLKLPLRTPQLKVSGGLRLRPWLFRVLVGEYPVHVSVLKINNNVLIGLPCDFSGELAVPLYAYAQERGINLTLTSFNGGYIGYVTKDEHYDLNKSETRSMNWYGPDSGAYFSEIVQRILNTLSE